MKVLEQRFLVVWQSVRDACDTESCQTVSCDVEEQRWWRRRSQWSQEQRLWVRQRHRPCCLSAMSHLRFCRASKSRDKIAGVTRHWGHSLANCDSCPTPAKSEAIEYLQVGPTEIRYSIAWTIFVYLQSLSVCSSSSSSTLFILFLEKKFNRTRSVPL